MKYPRLALACLLLSGSGFAQAECDTLFSWDFDSAPVPGVPISMTGLWHVTEDCPPEGDYGSGLFAYYGQDVVCDYDVGYTAGDLTIGPITIPAGSESVRLSFDSAYEGEICDFYYDCCDYDYARVLVNDQLVRDFCDIGWAWGCKSVDLTSYSLLPEDTPITVTFRFYTVDDVANAFRGAAVDNVRIDVACTGKNYCSTGANSTGFPARITSIGSIHVDENDFMLYCQRVPCCGIGYFLMSPNQNFLPGFGGSMGTLCVGPPLIRFNVQPPVGAILQATIYESVCWRPDLTQLPQNTVFERGSTWNFQYWFRDNVNNTPTSNTTNGYAVTFQ